MPSLGVMLFRSLGKIDMKIYKYTLFTQGGHGATGIVYMPVNAKILSCQMQQGSAVVWAEVNDSQPMISRNFVCYGTGFDLPDRPRKHIATLQDGGFVWHIFEEE